MENLEIIRNVELRRKERGPSIACLGLRKSRVFDASRTIVVQRSVVCSCGCVGSEARAAARLILDKN